MADVYGFDEAKNKVALSDGTGITVGDDGTINHTNQITAKTTFVGSATSVPKIKYDENGHITEVGTATIYPPTTAGVAGQVWTSDGAGAGSWQTPASGGLTRTITSLTASNFLSTVTSMNIGDEIIGYRVTFDEGEIQYISVKLIWFNGSTAVFSGSFLAQGEYGTYPGNILTCDSSQITYTYTLDNTDPSGTYEKVYCYSVSSVSNIRAITYS